MHVYNATMDLIGEKKKLHIRFVHRFLQISCIKHYRIVIDTRRSVLIAPEYTYYTAAELLMGEWCLRIYNPL